MDPNATLRLIQEHIDAAKDEDNLELVDAHQRCKDLYEWMAGGGFNPKWSDYPKAAALYGKLSAAGSLDKAFTTFDGVGLSADEMTALRKKYKAKFG